MKDRLLQVPVLGTALRMQERYKDDAADALAAAIGFFGFLSLFPLMSLVLGVVGTFLGDDVVGRARLVELVTQSVPALSSIAGGEGGVADAIQTISMREGSLYSFGTIGLILAGLRVATGAQEAIYCLLMLEHDFIAPSINVDSLDPALKPEEIATSLVENAGLDSVMTNSFGFGGTNGSMILSKYNG